MIAAAVAAALWTGSAGFARLTPTDFTSEDLGVYRVMTADVSSSQPFTQVVPSWNAEGEGSMLVGIQSLDPETTSYSLGMWSLDPQQRTSTNGQVDSGGQVLTDTLDLNRPSTKLRVTLALKPGPSGQLPRLKDFFLSLTPQDWKPTAEEPLKEAWGKEIGVPTKAQHNYPKGNVLCSPTSVAMLMNFWGGEAKKGEWMKDVPEVQAAVFDPAWGGTGNWPFNTAYPGSFPGLRGFVTRLSSMRQAEALIAAGIPVSCSINYKTLLNKDWEGDSGHLVVLIGFTANGDPIINDPAKKDQVRQEVPRDRFLAAWEASRYTIYVLSLADTAFPATPGPWPRS